MTTLFKKFSKLHEKDPLVVAHSVHISTLANTLKQNQLYGRHNISHNEKSKYYKIGLLAAQAVVNPAHFFALSAHASVL